MVTLFQQPRASHLWGPSRLLLAQYYFLHTCWISGFDLSFKYGMFYHVYADDTQISLPLKSVERYGCNSPLACLEEVRSWMSYFGSVKPELNWDYAFWPSQSMLGYRHTFRHMVKLSGSSKSLGVVFDPEMKFDSVVKSCFRLDLLLDWSLYCRGKIINAFVLSRLDYCNV